MAVLLNRITNGSFEAGLSGWAAQNVVIASTPVLNGFSAARLGGGENDARLVQPVAADPGDTFHLKLSIARDESGTTPITAVSVAYYDENDRFLSFGLIENIRAAPPSALRYQNVYQTTSPAPPGTARAEVTIERQGDTGTANVYVDQVILLQVITDASGAVPVLFPNTPNPNQQSAVGFRLFGGPNFTNILELNVTTTVPNQRVKIDGVVEIHFESDKFLDRYQSFVQLILNRNGAPLVELNPIRFIFITGGVEEVDKLLESTIFATVTYIDVVPTPGTYQYTIDGVVDFENDPDDIVMIETRGINATVFPPAAGNGPT